MTKQERAEFTIDYIRNRTEGVPDEFLPDISIALQEGMKIGESVMLRKSLKILSDFNMKQGRLFESGARMRLHDCTIDLYDFEKAITEDE